MAAVMTFNSLVVDIQTYSEKDDATFVADIPSFIALAENKIARECKGLGQQQSVTDTMIISQPTLLKPDRWRETISINYGTGPTLNKRKYIFERSLEFCRNYWPDPAEVAGPKYYADYSYSVWLLAGTPDQAYPYEVLYYERAIPLDLAHQTNWNTQYAPDLLLAACMLQAQPYLKNATGQAVWEGKYNTAAAGFSGEDKQRQVDRSTVVK